MSDNKTIVVAVSDVFFYTKIRDAFLPHGYKLERIRGGEDWLQKLHQNHPMGLIINMNDERLNVRDILQALKAQSPSLPVLAFANHEEVVMWKQAKELGIHKIVSRNEFSARTLALFEEMTASPAS